jgi:uracil-DNA glycosylase family 4
MAATNPAMNPWAELLRWYVDMGADEAIAVDPIDRLRPPEAAPIKVAPAPARMPPQATRPPPRDPVPAPPISTPSIAASGGSEGASARVLADAATTLAELERAVSGFDGCALRQTATRTVFADGNPEASLMLIGEAPGAEEDRLGKPFVGRSGQLLDRMLATIGIDRRASAYITNVLFWRPPGNRKPTPAEIASCLPFVLRHVALVHPAVIMLCGGTATSAVLGLSEGITRLRGRWFDLAIPGLAQPVATIATYHPSFLLRSPERKREAWRDLLSVQEKVNALRNSAEIHSKS